MNRRAGSCAALCALCVFWVVCGVLAGRAQAAPALKEAVAKHTDGYVRYRSLVLLTGFNDPRTKDSMPPCGGAAGRLTTDPPRGGLPRR
jgi:hypothetical protein